MPERDAIKHARSSGNVFADVGLPDEFLAKAELVSRIDDILSERHLTQREAATLLDIDQPRVFALLRGKLDLSLLERPLGIHRRTGGNNPWLKEPLR